MQEPTSAPAVARKSYVPSRNLVEVCAQTTEPSETAHGRYFLTRLIRAPSEGTPGEHYEYNGDLFANLFDPIIKASGKRYRLLLAENILQKIGTTGTAPSPT